MSMKNEIPDGMPDWRGHKSMKVLAGVCPSVNGHDAQCMSSTGQESARLAAPEECREPRSPVGSVMPSKHPWDDMALTGPRPMRDENGPK